MSDARGGSLTLLAFEVFCTVSAQPLTEEKHVT